jgi:hypothetical protein
MTRKEVEKTIRRAFEIDRILPYPRPENAKCYLGKLVVIPDNRSIDDIKEDDDRRAFITTEDVEIWEMVMTDWMPRLHGVQRAVVKYRCCGMGWKRIALTLADKKITHRVLDRSTLWRCFQHGLDEFCD